MDMCDNIPKLYVTGCAMAGFTNTETIYDSCDIENGTIIKLMNIIKGQVVWYLISNGF